MDLLCTTETAWCAPPCSEPVCPVPWQELERYRGPAARLLGALSLVNLVWALAIAGVAVSAGPALAVLAAPLRRLLVAALEHAALLVVRLVAALHPLWEIAAYTACAYIIGVTPRQSARCCCPHPELVHPCSCTTLRCSA